MTSMTRAGCFAVALLCACAAPSPGPDAGEADDTCGFEVETDAGLSCSGPSCATCVPDGERCPAGCTPIRGRELDRARCCRSEVVLVSCHNGSGAGEPVADALVCALREHDGATFEVSMFPPSAWSSAGLVACPGHDVVLPSLPDCDDGP